jgi:hypothetical protein
MVELPGDFGLVESRFGPFGDCVNVGPFGDSANLDARYVHGLCLTYHKLKNHFVCIRWNSLVTRVMWNLFSVRF